MLKPAIIGRESELARLATFLDGEPIGRGRGLLVTGAPGIGKSTLWDAGVDEARRAGFRVLSARASEPELRMSFVALADLLTDVEADELFILPTPQRRALEGALVRADAEEGRVDPFAVSAAFLTALRGLSASAPLLVAIDDIPWLDRPSAEALAFSIRRLDDRPVRFLLTRRPGDTLELERAFGFDALERLDLIALSLGAARVLLSERLGLTLPRRVLRLIVDTAEGNPLFMLELGRVVAERGLPDVGQELDVPDPVNDLFGPRVLDLPDAVRRIVLATSLDAGLTRPQLDAIANPEAVDDAVAAGLVTVDGERVRPAHPLLAAATRKHSSERERREVHRALANAVPEPARRVRHLARSATGMDPELGAELDAAAASAIARGAVQEAVELADHAVRLTPPDSPAYADRLVAYARNLTTAGELPRARELLEANMNVLPAGPTRSRAFVILAYCSDTVEQWERFVERALADSGDDPELRATALAMRSWAATIVFRDLDRAEEDALEALELAHRAGPEQERWALHALANIRLVRGLAFDDLCERFPSAPAGSSMEESAIDRAVGLRLVCRGETDAARGLFCRLRALAEERGEAESAGTMHLELCDLELRAGNVKAARSLMEEAEDWFAFDAGQRDRAAREAITAAIAGLPSETQRWAAEMIRNARATGTFVLEMEARRVLGVAALCAHDAVRAVEELRPIWAHMVREGIEEVGVWPMAPDLVEALIELGEVDEARVVTRRLRRLATEQDHPWGLASADRCEAMIRLALGDYDKRAAAQLDRAASAYGAIGMRFDEARSLLALGRAARRSRRWAAARGALERVGARRPSPAGALTPSEDRVARLAAEGLSNKDIAARLFITAHTVEKHLSHAFAKLGVTSRAQLAHLFAASA